MTDSNLWFSRSGSLPSLRILGLDWSDIGKGLRRGDAPPVSLVGSTLTKDEKGVVACLIPSLTKDGRVSLVFGSETLDGFRAIQSDISARFAKRLSEPQLWRQLSSLGLTNFLVVGFTLAFPEAPNRMFLIYETLVSPVPIPELFEIYTRLKSATSSLSNTEVVELESYFGDDVRKKWLNEFITGLENLLDWPKFVADAERRVGRK
jgi:hypothetical protein